MSEKVIYTAIFGSYEELKEPTVITPGWKYLCFTDQDINSDVWEFFKGDEQKDPQRQARMVKINYPSNQKQSIWLDASFQINCNLDDFWNDHYKGGISAPKHPARDCVYREAQVCMRRGLDANNVEKQIQRYADECLPGHAGLISSGILLRDNSEPVKEFCNLWWNQVSAWSVRDQIAFAYCDWKLPGVAKTFKYDYRVRQEFIYSKHYHARDKEPH